MTQPMFRRNPDDPGSYLISPAGVLLLLGHTAYEPESDTSAIGRKNAKRAEPEQDRSSDEAWRAMAADDGAMDF